MSEHRGIHAFNEISNSANSQSSHDQVTWMKYPSGNASQIGEQVNYTYHPQAALNSVTGSTNYVPGTQYNELFEFAAARQVECQIRPPRLLLKSGTPASPTSLQDLRYYSGTNTPVYDQAGNILNIYDWKAGAPQTQAFSYDDLNRLLSASASGGTGGLYSESYSYHPDTGNLYTKSSLGTYTYSSQPQARRGLHLQRLELPVRRQRQHDPARYPAAPTTWATTPRIA